MPTFTNAKSQAHFIWAENQTTLTQSLVQKITWGKHPKKPINRCGKKIVTHESNPVDGEWPKAMSLFNQQPNREQQFLSLKFSIGLLSKKT
jgi:hypothetical protein